MGPQGNIGGQQNQPQQAQGVSTVRVMTYNMRGGLYEKKLQLAIRFRDEHADIVALQETRVRRQGWALKFANYHCQEAFDAPLQPGERGLALLVRKGLSMYPVGPKSPFWVIARVSGAPFTSPWLFGCVYVPPARRQHRTVMRDLGACVARLSRRYNDPFVLMGDFNASAAQIRRTLAVWRGQFDAVGITGSPITWKVGQRQSSLDHVVGNAQARRALSRGKVDRSYGFSDHWPVKAKVSIRAAAQRAQTRRAPGKYDTAQLRLVQGQNRNPNPLRVQMQTSRRFGAIVPAQFGQGDPLPNLGMNAVAAAFVSAVRRAGSDAGVYKVARQVPANRQYAPDAQLQTLVRRRATLLRQAHQIERAIQRRRAPAQRPFGRLQAVRRLQRAKRRIHQQWLVCRGLAARRSKEVRKKGWQHALDRAIAAKQEEPARFWAWAQRTSGLRRENGTFGSQPMLHPVTRVLEIDANAIAAGWLAHYAALAAFPQRGMAIAAMQHAAWQRRCGGLRQYPVMRELDRDITWREIVETIRRMKRGKAAGPDEIPVEVLAVATGCPTDGAGYPVSAFGRALFAVILKMWETATIPQAWHSATVVSLYKKGDPTDRNNYRGISLISVTLKVLCALLAHRLSQSLESHQRLVREQAGFRSKEEAVAQATTLLEVLDRRSRVVVQRLETVVTFFDLRKAFDTVPHGALFYKMRCIGIPPIFLAFVSSLYLSSKIHVRKPDGTPSRDISLRRGVRQGCPLSPVLFLIFMNDVFEDCWRRGAAGWQRFSPRQHGVIVPGHGNLQDRLPGLMFADDLATMAPTPGDSVALKDHLGRWADTWGMEWGVNKCGLMFILPRPLLSGIGRHAAPRAARMAQLRQYFQGTPAGTLAGQQIPIVSTYTYLGVEANDKLDEATMAKARLEKARRLGMKTKSFMQARSIPLAARAIFVKTVLVTKVLYGAEYWGFSQARCRPIFDLVKTWMRWLLGRHGKTTSVSIQPMQVELHFPSPYAYANARAARLWVKAAGLRTWLGVLFTSANWRRDPIRHQSWFMKKYLWMTKYTKNILRPVGQPVPPQVRLPPPAAGGRTLDPPTLAQCLLMTQDRLAAARAGRLAWQAYSDAWAKESKVWYMAVLRATNERMLAKGTSESWRRYKLYGYGDSRPSKLSQIAPVHGMGYGMQAVAHVRMRSLRVAARYYAHRAGRRGCRFCNMRVQETIAHLLVTCPRWRVQRQMWLAPLLQAARQLFQGPLAEGDVAVLLAGGQIRGVRLAAWEMSLTVTPRPQADAVLAVSGLVRNLARFLQAVNRRRIVLGRLKPL